MIGNIIPKKYINPTTTYIISFSEPYAPFIVQINTKLPKPRKNTPPKRDEIHSHFASIIRRSSASSANRLVYKSVVIQINLPYLFIHRLIA